MPEYFLFDPFACSLEGYELDSPHGRFRPKPRDESGRVHSDRLELSLGVVESGYQHMRLPWLRWIDSKGQVLPHAGERAELEARRAELEARRADELAARLAELEAKCGKV